jgi:hypothetical protein
LIVCKSDILNIICRLQAQHQHSIASSLMSFMNFLLLQQGVKSEELMCLGFTSYHSQSHSGIHLSALIESSLIDFLGGIQPSPSRC